MSLSDRKALYELLESLRRRPLIVYVTSFRPNLPAGPMGIPVGMAGDVIPELLDQLALIEPASKAVDLLVVSYGGDPTVAWRIMSLLREKFERIAVLVPQAAYSAATLLALGADEIVMHPNGNLGPVDPQVVGRRKRQGSEEFETFQFGYEDLTGFLEFLKGEGKITDQGQVRRLFQQFCQEVGCVPVGVAARGSQLSISMGEKLLRMHMVSEADAAKARAIAEALNRKYFHHGYPVSRKEAKDIGLKIADPNQNVEDAIWKIWLDIEQELKIRQPFDPIAELLNSAIGPRLLAPVPTITLPLGLPASLLQQVAQKIASQLNVQIEQLDPVDFELITAVLESTRAASRCVANGKILGGRQPDLRVSCSMITTRRGWNRVAVM